ELRDGVLELCVQRQVARGHARRRHADAPGFDGGDGGPFHLGMVAQAEVVARREVQELPASDGEGRPLWCAELRLAAQKARLREVLGLGAQELEECLVSHSFRASFAVLAVLMNHTSDDTQVCQARLVSSAVARQYWSMFLARLSSSSASPV